MVCVNLTVLRSPLQHAIPQPSFALVVAGNGSDWVSFAKQAEQYELQATGPGPVD